METPKRQTSILSFLSGTPPCDSPCAVNKENDPKSPLDVNNEAVIHQTGRVAKDVPSDNATPDERYPWILSKRDKCGRHDCDPEYDPSTIYIPSEQWRRFTPFEKQYWEVKSEHYDSVVFFKKGKFFEVYENDADLAASLFDLKVTERVNMKMAGVPESSFNVWAARFISAGYKVVKVDQAENMIGMQIRKRTSSVKDDSKIIERKISGIYTSGTIVDVDLMNDDSFSFCASVFFSEHLDHFKVEVIFCDVSLRSYITEEVFDDLHFYNTLALLGKYNPKEILCLFDQSRFFAKIRKICTAARFSVCSDRSVRLFGRPVNSAMSLLECYLTDLQQTCSIQTLKKIHEGNLGLVPLDGRLLESLEIVSNERRKKSLISTLNHTLTASGLRKLYRWVISPLTEKKLIQLRQQCVATLVAKPDSLERIRSLLKLIPDVERLFNSIESTSNHAKLAELLVNGLANAKTIITEAQRSFGSFFASVCWDQLSVLFDSLPSSNLQEALLARNSSLADLKALKTRVESNLEKYRRDLEVKLCTKVQFRNVGKEHFLLEMEQSVKPSSDLFVMSRTKSVVRYWSDAVKRLAAEYDEVEEQIRAKISDCYRDYLLELATHRQVVSTITSIVSDIDCFQSLANFALGLGTNRCLPEFDESETSSFVATEMKHPLFAAETSFIPNDITMSRRMDSHCVILTGPNMGGKSTIMKQVCLLAILAQVGSFVPAKSYKASIFSRILSRIGASDNILKGSSTFMTELEEMRNILQTASGSGTGLFIVDEFGRGTSTHDGVSLARSAVLELRNKNCICLFATHYKDIVKFDEFPQSSMMYMGFSMSSAQLVFQYKLLQGVSPSSFATSVAAIIGIPPSIIEEANTVSHTFTSRSVSNFDPGLLKKLHQLCLLAS